MSLPKIAILTHELKLPLSGKVIHVRPFIVKEEKILMMALESKDPKEITTTLNSVINSCIQEENFKAEDLSIIDYHFVVVKLRAMSKGDTIEITATCNQLVEDEESCGHKNEMDLELDKIVLDGEFDPKDNKIQITENTGIILSPPKGTLLEHLSGVENTAEAETEAIKSCIDMIWEDEEIFYAKEATTEELDNFIDMLPTYVVKKINEYVKSLPSLVLKSDFICEKCGKKSIIEIKDLKSFLV